MRIALPNMLVVTTVVFMALVLGAGAVLQTTMTIVPFILAGAIFAGWYALRYPPATIGYFWLMYSLQTTVFAEALNIAGLYYPLYLLMLVNAWAFMRGKQRRALQPAGALMLLYVCFCFLVGLGVLWHPVDVSVNVTQRLFIYGLGFLTCMQLTEDEHRNTVYKILSVVGILVSSWVVIAAVATGFQYRGGVAVNPNYVATLIATGILPIFSGVMQPRGHGRRLLLLFPLGVALYAVFLLASRGVTIALAVGCLIIVLRHARSWFRVASVGLLLIVLGTVLLNLPGARNFDARWSESGTEQLNGRVPLWGAGLDQLRSSSVMELIFGQGMGASEKVVRRVTLGLTSMHNAYMQITIDYGILGTVLYVSLLLGIVRQAVLRRGHAADVSLGIIGFLATAALTADVTDNFVFWILLGVTLPRLTLREEAPMALRGADSTSSAGTSCRPPSLVPIKLSGGRSR